MNTPTPGAAAELPVVCWLYHDGPTLKEIPDDMLGSVLLTFRRQDWCRNESALTYLNDAQSQLDALREEVARLTKELDEAREVIDQRNAMCSAYFAELAALKAKPTDIERLIDAATGKLRHVRMGLCPDELEGFDTRDPDCPACEALRTALAARKEEL